MKSRSSLLFILITVLSNATAQTPGERHAYEVIKIGSHIPGLSLGMIHEAPATGPGQTPVLFIHGSSFPSALASGFRMNGMSWMDFMADNHFDCYGLDFLGYGYSDRYPDQPVDPLKMQPPGRAREVYADVDSAVTCILRKTGSKKVNIIAHSWGCSVAALYASKYPDKILHLVLFAPLTCEKSDSPAPVYHYRYERLTPGERVEMMKAGTPAGEVCPLEPELASEWQKQWLASDPRAATNGKGRVSFPAGPSQDIADLAHGSSYYDASLIFCPTLVIRGDWDRWPSDVDAKLLYSQLSNAPSGKYITIPKGTHVLHLERNRHQLYLETLNFLNPSVMSTNDHHAIAVIFEVTPNPGERQEYLDIAAALKPELVKIDGFISIERFQSLTNPDKILSLSFWRDEEAIRHWRNLEVHRTAQSKGREFVFKDYHLRIADVVRDYGMFDRTEAPADSKEYHQQPPR
jgi:pimeloyl-ACP methyl ester carboxylesterase/heme-degrading monooxygenase HmoA